MVAQQEIDPTRGVKPGDSSDTPGHVPPNNDQLGCGPGLTVSDMEAALLNRLVELRSPAGAKGLQVNHDLMLACRDACLRVQGDENLDQAAANVEQFLAQFGWRGQRCDIIQLHSVKGRADNPPDAGDLIHVIARADKELAAILTSQDWNEVGCSVYGSCYGMGAVLAVGSRQASPGPNP